MPRDANDTRSSFPHFFRRSARTVFIDDWALKVIALIISLGLWYGVTGQRTPSTARITSVPLLLHLPKNLEISNPVPEYVSLIINGDKDTLDQLNQRTLTASLDLRDLPVGERQIQLTAETLAINLPAGSSIQSVDPASIVVQVVPAGKKLKNSSTTHTD
jgi:YbbR domain-containing protein